MRWLWVNAIVLTLAAAPEGRAQIGREAEKEAPAPINDQQPVSVRVQPSPDVNQTTCCEPATVIDCADCCEPNRFWVQGDYLLWWIKRAPLGTPLVTTDPSQGVAKGSGGLANPTTQVLLGGNGVEFNPFSGGQVCAGYSPGNGLGVEVSGFLLGQQDPILRIASDRNGSPFLLRPIVNSDANNLNAGIVVSLPLSSALALGAKAANAGAVEVDSPSQLWGANAVLTAGAWNAGNTRLTGMIGFRYLGLREATDISTGIIDTAAGITFGGVRDNPGDALLILDGFQTRNYFYGGQAGLRSQTQWGSLVLAADARVSLGDTRQTLAIQGSTTRIGVAGGTQTLPGGWLALPSNSGTFNHDRFTVVPEVNLNVGYALRSWVRLSVGYNFLFWSSVLRPGDQLLPVASAGAKTPPPFGQVPTFPGFGPGAAPVPPVPDHTTSFWAQGLNFSVNFSF